MTTTPTHNPAQPPANASTTKAPVITVTSPAITVPPDAYSYRSTCDKARASRFLDKADAERFTRWARGRVQEVPYGDKTAYIVELRPWTWAGDVAHMQMRARPVATVAGWLCLLAMASGVGAAFGVSV
jgi:hypothetical protein